MMNPPQNARAWLAFGHDMTAVFVSWLGAIWFLGLFEKATSAPAATLAVALAMLLVVHAATFFAFGLYQGLWRYASLHDIQRIVLAVLVATVAAFPLTMVAGIDPALPKRFFLLQPIVLLLQMALSRLTYRSWKEYRIYGRSGAAGTPVLVLGAGDRAASVVKELNRSREWRVIGLLDDDERKQGRLLQGVQVLGSLADLSRFAQRLEVRHVIIAIPSLSYAERRRLVEVCKRLRVTVMTVPSLDQVLANGGALQPARPRRVAVQDLLKREPVVLDDREVREFISGKVVMVTGAGGSIGSELCRQIAALAPAQLVLYELNEFALYRIHESLADTHPSLNLKPVVGDIKNAERVAQTLELYAPEVIFHAAAYKHVPLMEEINAWEAVRNNVLGTYVLARAAIDASVRKFVFISTDKAVNPANVMGATKRLAELVCLSLQGESITRFETVRFGNVAGSAGSVIPKFEEQIARGGPVTVTHPQMVRYFMSVSEASQLVLQAGAIGLGGEIFVLDMGEAIRIEDLARDMIRLSELSEDDIQIVYTGLRPGEKLFEEPLADDEHTRATPYPKLRVARAPGADGLDLRRLVDWLTQDGIVADADVRRELKRWVPEYVVSTKPKLVAVKTVAA